MAADVATTLDALLACMVEALETASRPVRTSGVTVGAPVLGPSVCCADCDGCDTPGNGQLVGYVQRIYPVDANTFSQQARIENCKPGAVAADMVFELDRCYPTIDEQGNPPTLDEIDPYAAGAITDAQVMWNTFTCPCDEAYRVVVRDLQMGGEPNGGCSAVALSVTVLVTPTNPVVVDVS